MIYIKHIVETWKQEGIRGVWLTIPIEHAKFVAAAVENEFTYHHAKPAYLLLTRWLPTDTESTLPNYAFTQIGVGAVVVNESNDKILMVQERVSPLPLYVKF